MNAKAKDIGIVAGAIIAVIIAIYVAFHFITSDRPQPVGPTPQNVVGQSEKARAMKAQAASQNGGAPAPPGPPEVKGGGTFGDNVEPPGPK